MSPGSLQEIAEPLQTPWTTGSDGRPNGRREVRPVMLIAKEKRWVSPNRFSSRLNRRD